MRNDGHNPLLPPDIHIPDGEAHVMPVGRLYVYGSFPDGSIPEVRMTSQGPGCAFIPNFDVWALRPSWFPCLLSAKTALRC